MMGGTSALKTLFWSLRLDRELLGAVRGVPLSRRLAFVAAKYPRYLRDGVAAGAHSAVVFGHRFCYNGPLGPGSLQRVYCASHTLRELLPARPVVLDVGANIGQFNFFAAHYLGAARVVSVEPVAECHRLLAQNALCADDCLCCAISDREGEVEFHLAQESQLSSYVADAGTAYRGTRSVPARTLDAVAAEFGLERVDLLKIDTEGSELDVLKSAEGVLSRTSAVLVEMSVFRPSAGNLFSTGAFLEERGFRLAELTGGEGRRPSDVDALFVRP